MSFAVARLGDTVTGICNGPGHVANRAFTGTWHTCSGTAKANGLGIVRVGDTGTTDCNHNFVATQGSSIGTANGLQIHRVGDAVQVVEGGHGTTVTGSNTVFSD